MPTPPVPPGMTLPQFGKALWGVGDDDAVAQTTAITLEQLTNLGLTLALAELWREFYERECIRGRGLPTSRARADLLKRCTELLSG
ncbi:MAG: hypothetical protein J5I93_23135 [Pirellulaceae bacterium]|nr:hypothetical protein [Pirellulaceae bacterium]